MPTTENVDYVLDANSEFMTVDILTEQLAVINDAISKLSTSSLSSSLSPSSLARRTNLIEERAQLINMIEAGRNLDRGDSGSSGSASASLSPSFSPQIDLSKNPSTSASGFTTPEMHGGQSFSRWDLNFDDTPVIRSEEEVRQAQELADWQLAQQIASQLADDDELERQRQRQAQIEADEEFARQIEQTFSPIMDRPREPLHTDLNYLCLDNDALPPSQATQGTATQVSPPHDSPLRTRQESHPQTTRCEKCSEPFVPGDDYCWRCDDPFQPLAPTAQPVQPVSLPTQSTPLPGSFPQIPNAQPPQTGLGGPFQSSYNPFTFTWPPQQSQLQSQTSTPPLPQSNYNRPQFPATQQIQSQPYIGQGTSSNPIDLDSPIPSNPFQQTSQILQRPLPGSFSSVYNASLLNNGWPVPGFPFQAPKIVDPASYLSNIAPPVYDHGIPPLTSDEIKDLLANIRPDEDIKVEDKDAIIPGLAKHMRLMKHQQMGLAWMQKMEDGKNKGGILADDMGLGKTIQSIALLVSRPSEDKKCKTTLICTPVALLRQWYNEIRTKTSPALNVYIHHTSARGKKARTAKELLHYDVVLTTYNTLAHEWKSLDRWESAMPELRTGDRPSSLFLDTTWYRIILDEAQIIKNRFTQTAKAAHRLNATYRWSLSGTPMQNGVEEMYSQLAFLRIKPYLQWKAFHDTFVIALKKASRQSAAMRKFQALLKAILLRRTKMSKIDGVEIIKGLPGKTIQLVHAVFDEEQLQFYRALETGAIDQLRKYQNAGTLGRNFGNALVMLLRLRQACLHPKLIKEVTKAGSTELTMDEQVYMAKEFSPQTIARIKDIPVFECPICFETILNPTLILPCGHHYCTECLSSLFDQEREDALASGEAERVKAKCPGCRGDMDAKRIVSLEAFKTAHCSEVGEAPEDSESEAEEDWSLDEDRKRKGKEPAHTMKAAKRQRPMEEEPDWVSSAKIDKLCEILDSVRENDPREKVIVFSQFTGFLNLISPALRRRNYKFGRYDGEMSAREREEELESFKTDPLKTVCLVSLRAGAYGLNLTCASQCVILDPFWNPFVEDQAIDRIHRIGQSRPVVVHRIVIEQTVEDRILALQEKKRDIIEGALAEDASKAIARLSAKDLLFLFGIGG